MRATPGAIVDAHHHLWDPERAAYAWMTGDYRPLSRPYGTSDLAPLIEEAGVTSTVVVEARTDIDETLSLLEIASRTDWIAGVVGWVDLTDAAVSDTLAEVLENPTGAKLAGIRHPAHDEPDPEWLIRPDVMSGLAALAEAGLTFDLLVRSRELPAATQVARQLPGLRFVVDHIAKPPIATGQLDPWRSLIGDIAALPNVVCKVSGLVTEADWEDWKPADLIPYVAAVVDAFGPDRLMYGSDWPVCTLAASYSAVFETAVAILTELVGESLDDVLGGTARATYLDAG